jgi:hypothetical protein
MFITDRTVKQQRQLQVAQIDVRLVHLCAYVSTRAPDPTSTQAYASERARATYLTPVLRHVAG